MLIQHIFIINRLITQFTFYTGRFIVDLFNVKVDSMIVPELFVANRAFRFLVVRAVNLAYMLIEAFGALKLLVAMRAL